MKKILTVCLLVLMSVNVFSNVIDVKHECQELVGQYWNIVDYKYSDDINEEKLCEMMDSFNNRIQIVTLKVAHDCEEVENSSLSRFSEFYQDCPVEVRPVFDRVVKGIIECARNLEPQKDTGRLLREYFPGFGYSDPDFQYRKGKETSSEFLYARWVDEEKTFSQEKEFELTVELKLVAELKLKFPNIKVLKEFGVEIGGNFVMCAKVRIKTSKTLTVKTKKKIGQYKRWFELLKAKKTFWSTPVWSFCGKTYVHFAEPTGEEVATEVKDIT